ncbi:MAG: Do family serine endopeptidase [Sphingomonadales bacterium]
MTKIISKTRELRGIKTIQYSIMTMVVMAMLVFSYDTMAKGAPDSFADLAEKLLPSVVNISTIQTIEQNGGQGAEQFPEGSPFRDFFERFNRQNPNGNNQRQEQPPREARSLGSGFFISADGFIVTNDHVIDKADEITVTLVSGETYEAKLIGTDPASDIALIKIEVEEDLIFVDFGDSDKIRVGDWVMAIGNPFGLGGSVTAGIVSARHRNINAGQYDDFIQTDASINKGNSGGPMFDMDGAVIGVNTMIFSPTGGNIGIGFSIPSRDVSRVVGQLKEHGETKRSRIGVTIRGIDEETAESLGIENTEGAIVNDVVPGGPADKAGVIPYDIILSFDGEKIEESRELPRVVSNTTIGKKVAMRVLRNGQVIVLNIVTEELVAANTNGTTAVEEEGDKSPNPQSEEILGLSLTSLNKERREEFLIGEEIEGVFISNLSPQSEGARRGMRPGDVIVQVNQVDVSKISAIKDIIVMAREAGRSAALFRIYRRGQYTLIALPLEEDEK